MPLRRLRPATVPAPARVPALLAALALCALLAPTTARAQARRPMSFEDMMRLNQVSDAQLSPDGKWVAYVVAHNDMDKDATLRDIYVVGATGGEPVRFTASGKSDASPRWSPDGKWIAFISTRGEHPQVYLISATGGEATPLTDSRSGVNSFAWSPDGTRIAYVAARAPTAEEEKKQKDKDDAFAVDHDYRYTRIWTIDVATKKATEIVSGDFQANNPDWSPDGQWIAFTEAPTPRADDGQLTDLYVVSSTGGTPRKLFSNDGPDNAPRWSPDGKSIAFLTRVGKVATVGQLQLAIISPDGGTPRMVAPSFPYQPGPATWSHDGNTLYFEAPVRTTSQLFSVSAQGGTPRQLTNVQGVISSATFSRDDRTAAFVESDAQHPGDVYVAQLGDGMSGTKRTDHNPQVRDFAMGNAEVLRWKGTDGMDVEGVLYYPAGYQPGHRYPLLTVVHGGPAGAWDQSFADSWYQDMAQVWAGRGWAVLYPNPRGSTNYGEKFLRANIKDWGGGDFHDIQRGIDRVIAMGVADSTKLAQSGWSYGGYMTAWTLTQTNRFKAVMVGAGLTDMPSMYGTNDIPRTIDGYFLAEPWNDPQQYAARSAMTFIKQARTPTLIQHGQADPRVPIGQSQELYTGLRLNHIPVDLVFFPREPHGLGEPFHQLSKVRNEYAWFARWVLGESAPEKGAIVP